MAIDWDNYAASGVWDELIGTKGRARRGGAALKKALARLGDGELQERRAAAELAIRTMGITFTVYSDEGAGGIDREWPFDIIPRLIRKSEWDRVKIGLKQRVNALNQFIDDIYHDQNILNDDVIPRHHIERSKDFRPNFVVYRRRTKYGLTSVDPT